MILKVLILVLISTLLNTCSKNGEKNDVPFCINNLIKKRNQTDNCLDKVAKYQYKGQVVYLFTSDCSDYFQDLYNDNCILICRPSGGISGDGDGKCKDFYTETTNEEIVWQK